MSQKPPAEWNAPPFPPSDSPADAIEELRHAYANSDNGLFLMEALELCADEGIAPPDWCRIALDKVRRRWNSGKSRTFGEAMRIKRPWHWRQLSHQHRSKTKGLIYLAVRESHRLRGYALNSSQKEGKSAFSEVGEKLYLSAKKIEAQYYEEKALWDNIYRGMAEKHSGAPENDPEYWRNYIEERIEVDLSNFTFSFRGDAASLTLRTGTVSND